MPKRSSSLTQVASSAAIAVLLGVCLTVLLIRRKEERVFYSVLLITPAVGSLWGVKGRLFAFLGAVVAGAIGAPLVAYVLIVANEDDWRLTLQEAAMLVICGVTGIAAGAILGGIVAAILPHGRKSAEPKALPPSSPSEEIAQSVAPPDSPTTPVPSLAARRGTKWVAVLSLAIVAALVAWAIWHTRTRSVTPFDEVVAAADRIVIRAGGFNYCGSADDEAVLFEVTDRSEIQALVTNLKSVISTYASGKKLIPALVSQ